MRFNLLSLGMLLTAGAMLQGCSTEEIEVPAEELYARDFIKTFGVIDPKQDWTAAQKSNVTVKTSAPTRVKVIAEFNGKQYLFADYTEVSGTEKLTFDLPKGVSDITVRANGRDIKTTIGSTVNIASTGSREVVQSKSGDVDVTIKALEGDHSYLTLSRTEVENYQSMLPEEEQTVEYYKPQGDKKGTNLWRKEVDQNFMATAKTFWIFPQYYDTNQYLLNQIGIYFHVEEGTPGAIEVKPKYNDKDYSEEDYANGVVKKYWVKKVPIYKAGEILTYLERMNAQNYTALSNWGDLAKDEIVDKYFDGINPLPGYWAELAAQFPEKFRVADGSEVLKEEWDGTKVYYEVGTLLMPDSYNEGKWLEGKSQSFWDSYNEFFWLLSKHTDRLIGYQDKDQYWLNKYYVYDGTVAPEPLPNGQNDKKSTFAFNTAAFKSTGIEITFSEETRFGFYLERYDGITHYSEAALNGVVTLKNEEGEDQDYPACRVATYNAGKDSNGNDKRYLCFEDWQIIAGKNFDLNDMVFRVYGFDEFNPEVKPEIPDGDIIPDPDPTPTDPEPFTWIVACEDLGGTFDYDFNDVVFGVQYTPGDADKRVYVTGLAAGGTLPIHLYYNGVELTGSGDLDQKVEGGNGPFAEWHGWFGKASNQIVNVKGEFAVGATVSFVPEGEFTMSADLNKVNSDIDTSVHGFTVWVEKNGKLTKIKRPTAGGDPGNNTPQMFVTTVNFQWPLEMTPIYATHQGTGAEREEKVERYGHVYNTREHGFQHWVTNASADFHLQGLSHPGQTVNHGWKGFNKPQTPESGE